MWKIARTGTASPQEASSTRSNDRWKFSGGQWSCGHWCPHRQIDRNLPLPAITAATNTPSAQELHGVDRIRTFSAMAGLWLSRTVHSPPCGSFKAEGFQARTRSAIGSDGLRSNPEVWPHRTHHPGSRWGAGYSIDNDDQGSGGEGFDASGGNGNSLNSDLCATPRRPELKPFTFLPLWARIAEL